MEAVERLIQQKMQEIEKLEQELKVIEAPAGAICFFYITGFGKFANVLENPSSKLVELLPELLKRKALKNVELAHCEVVTVAI